jgi:hypothetical protein
MQDYILKRSSMKEANGHDMFGQEHCNQWIEPILHSCCKRSGGHTVSHYLDASVTRKHVETRQGGTPGWRLDARKMAGLLDRGLESSTAQ